MEYNNHLIKDIRQKDVVDFSTKCVHQVLLLLSNKSHGLYDRILSDLGLEVVSLPRVK